MLDKALFDSSCGKLFGRDEERPGENLGKSAQRPPPPEPRGMSAGQNRGWDRRAGVIPPADRKDRLQRLDAPGQPGDFPGGHVFLDHAARHAAHQLRLRLSESLAGRLAVASRYRRLDLLDESADSRPAGAVHSNLAGVASRPLLRGCRVGHRIPLERRLFKRKITARQGGSVCAAPFLVGHRPLFALRLSPAARERPRRTLMANTRPARMRGSAEPAARRQRRAALGLLLPNPRRGHGREKSLKSLTGAGGLGERNVVSGPVGPAFGRSGRLSPRRTEESVAFGEATRPSLAAPFPAANGRCDADPWGRDNRKRGFERAEARQERFSGTRFPSRSPLRVSRLDGSRLPYF